MIDISKLYSSPAYAAGEAAANQQPRTASADAFRNSLIRQASETSENELPTDASQRRKLSDAEIAVLRGRYDVRNMSDEQYDDFLDDPEDMGAISPWEKELLDDGGSAADCPDEEPGIIDQLRDPGSAFYQDMFQKMRVQLEESEEEKKKQAIIDALSAILEGMRSTDGAPKRKDMVSSVAELSRQISRLDEDDPRRTQLDLFRRRLNRMGICMDLDAGGRGGKHSVRTGETLTQLLIREEEQTFHFDII